MKTATKQEERILSLIASGYSSREIALELAISKYTVEAHRKSLLTKFGAKNSPDLVRKAIQSKVIITNTSFPKDNNNLTQYEE